ncbi:MAG TPA: NUDIX hydrolase [Patescibacteria group bacterium]|nr:NUDIX hydrolase [Patescibacteria group bacterium]
MKWLWQKVGILAFWVTFPGLAIYLSRSERTRIVIASGDRIVVVKGWLGNGKWTLPGGGLHKGEAPLVGCLREVREETGLVLDPTAVRLFFAGTYHYHGIHFPCHYFFVRLPEPIPLRPQFLEIVDAAWIAESELGPRTADPDVRNALSRLTAQSDPR